MPQIWISEMNLLLDYLLERQNAPPEKDPKLQEIINETNTPVKDKLDVFRRSCFKNLEMTRRIMPSKLVINDQAYEKFYNLLSDKVNGLTDDRYKYHKATMLCSTNSVFLITDIKAIRFDEEFNESARSKTSFKFSTPGAPYHIELKNDGTFDVKMNSENNPNDEIVKLSETPKVLESVQIEVRYDPKKTCTKTVQLRVLNVKEVGAAKHALRNSKLAVEERRVGQHIILKITRKRNGFNNRKFMEYFIKNVMERFHLQYDSFEFGTVSVDPVQPMRDWNDSDFTKPIDLFARNLLSLELGMEEDDSSVDDDQMDEMDQAVASKQFSFDVEETEKEDENILSARYFGENFELGVKVANKCVEKWRESNFMQFRDKRFYLPDMITRVQKLVKVSKKVWIACKSEIARLAMVHVTEDAYPDGVNETDVMDSLKLVQNFSKELDDGYIGFIGWPPSWVTVRFSLLQKRFKPIIIVITLQNEHLLFGAGELFLKKMIEIEGNRILVDIDRFNRRIKVFGDNAEKFVEKIKYFGRVMFWDVSGRIPLYPPYNNVLIQDVLTTPICEALSTGLASSISFDGERPFVEFFGPFKAFETFTKLLKSINNDIFQKLSSHLPIQESHCPVCQNPVTPIYYRLDSCGHVYCRECLNGLVYNFFDNDDFLPKCIYENCQKYVCPMDLKDIILGGENRDKFLDSEKMAEMAKTTISRITQQNYGFHKCREADCLGILKPSGKKGEIEICKVCNKVHCAKCLETHPEYSNCEAFKKVKECDKALEMYVDIMGPNKVKRCPTSNCPAIIEKDNGCNHMTCTLCHTHFCWICDFKNKKGGVVFQHTMLHRLIEDQDEDEAESEMDEDDS